MAGYGLCWPELQALTFTSITRISRRCIGGLFLYTLSLLAWCGPLEDGIEAAKAQNFSSAEVAWKQALSQGSMDAAHNLAGLYLSGVLGPPNFNRALDLFKQAAAAGHVQSIVGLGYVYQNGVGTTVDIPKATDYFKLAAEKGSIEGKFRFAEVILKTPKDPVQTKMALGFIEESSKAGFPPALNAVGDMLRHGAFVPKNIKLALDYYKSAANAGYAESAYAIADVYLNGVDLERDMGQALEWLKTSSKLGSSEAGYVLGYLHTRKNSPSQDDLRLAAEYFLQAAKNWHEKAQLEYAAMLLTGHVVKKNPVEAFKWLELSASTGLEEAHYLRAIVAQQISDVDAARSRKDAQKWFEKNHVRPHKHRNNAVVHLLR